MDAPFMARLIAGGMTFGEAKAAAGCDGMPLAMTMMVLKSD